MTQHHRKYTHLTPGSTRQGPHRQRQDEARMLASLWAALAGLAVVVYGQATPQPVDSQLASFFSNADDRHTNNWAVLACTSRYWFNYRVCTLREGLQY